MRIYKILYFAITVGVFKVSKIGGGMKIVKSSWKLSVFRKN